MYYIKGKARLYLREKMEPLFHCLLTILLTENLVCALGSLLPDTLYFFLLFAQPGKYNPIWEFRLYKLGERFHSVFLMSLMFGCLGYLNIFFLNLGVGYMLHLFVDVFTSKNNVLYPQQETWFTCQVFDWQKHPRLTIILDLSLILIIVLRGVISWIPV